MKELKKITNSTEETHQLGIVIGQNVSKNMVILLDGDLGAGKTTLTQGIAKGLGIKRNVTSPTFTIQKIYHGEKMNLYHIDAYRMEGIEQDLGFDEYFYDDGLTVIEWSQFMKYLIPEEYLMISIHLLENGAREFCFEAHGNQYEKLLEDIR